MTLCPALKHHKREKPWYHCICSCFECAFEMLYSIISTSAHRPPGGRVRIPGKESLSSRPDRPGGVPRGIPQPRASSAKTPFFPRLVFPTFWCNLSLAGGETISFLFPFFTGPGFWRRGKCSTRMFHVGGWRLVGLRLDRGGLSRHVQKCLGHLGTPLGFCFGAHAALRGLTGGRSLLSEAAYCRGQ